MASLFPPLPLDAWEPTKHTLHLYLQIIGKIRLARMPKQNHWWHVPLYVTPNGLTTGLMPVERPTADRTFAIDVNLQDHRVHVHCSDGTDRAIALRDGLSVAAFYDQMQNALAALSIEGSIHPVPFDHPDSTIPFPDDETHAAYDAEAVERFATTLTHVAPVFQTFAGRFLGKASPVHLFWHSFDLAYTRFSGREAPPLPDADPVTKEAYSHEVISFGFWAGDATVRAPAFYSYTYPEPDALTDAPLQPDAAYWASQDNGSLAIFPYEAARTARDPSAAVLAFLESAYQAGADHAKWDVDALHATA